VRRCALALAAVAGSAASAAAEPAVVKASVELRVGAAAAPFYVDALPETSSEFTQARSMIFAGSYRVARSLWVGGRLPAAPSTVRQPAGSYSDEKAFGNPEASAEWLTPPVALGARALVHLAVAGAIGLPLAGHGTESSLLENRVVALSSALDDWRNPQLYEPGVVPLTAAARARIEPTPWGGELAVELPIMVRVGEASLPDEADTHPIGLVPHIEARGLVAPLGWLTAELGGHIAVQAVRAVEPAERSERSGRVQIGIEPGLCFRPGAGVSLTTRFSAALGGPLAGTYAIGLGAAVER
jgi:hypothetical protein